MKLSGIDTLKATAAATVVSSVLLLSACGGSGGGTTAAPLTEDTSVLVQNAVKHASQNVGVNLNGMAAMSGNSTLSQTLGKSKMGKSQMGKSLKSSTSSSKDDSQTAAKYDDELRDIILPTLEGGNATQTRNGNVITVDPDERYLCEEWLADHSADASTIDECAIIFSDLTARITATSDDTGTLSYLYAGSNLLDIQYAPTIGSYEFFLPTFKNLAQRTTEVTGEPNYLPDAMNGAIKIATQIDNTLDGQEAGRLSFAISQPLQIASSVDNYAFTLGRSTLFDVQSNAGTNNGRISVAVNEMNLAARGLLGSDDDAVTTMSLPDFTLSADLERSGTEVLLSNVGMGRGPFRVAVNDVDVLTVALAKFSARFNDLTREAEFLSNLDLAVTFDYTQAAFGYPGDESSMRLSASTPAGTILTQQQNGSTKVESGGPFSYQYAYVDGSEYGESFEQDVTYTAGQCFDEIMYSDGYELVGCD